jgi:hypothetical protein
MNRQLILKQTEEFQYILIKISREECEEVQALMRLEATESDKYPFIQNIEGCAHISKVTESQLIPYIPIYNKWRIRNEDFPLRATYTNEFQCYGSTGRDFKTLSSPIIIHEDRLSAFKCACTSIRAEYFYIEKRTYIPLGEGILYAIKEHTPLTYKSLKECYDELEKLKLNNDQNGTNNNNDSAIRPEDSGI